MNIDAPLIDERALQETDGGAMIAGEAEAYADGALDHLARALAAEILGEPDRELSQLVEHDLDAGVVELLLAHEVVMDHREADACALRDVADGGLAEAARRKKRQRALHDS